MATEKQQQANNLNAQQSTGPKTDEGKATSKYNALKHGIFQEVITDYEADFHEALIERLNDEFQPQGILEKILVDRIGGYYLKLFRAAKAENEFMRSTLNPRRIKNMLDLDSLDQVVSEGYTPTVNQEAVSKLSDTYLRYETTVENRLYKALHELQRVQAIRKGERPPFPAVDIELSKGE